MTHTHDEIMAMDADALRLAIAETKGWKLETKTVSNPTRNGEVFTYTASFWVYGDDLHREPPYWSESISAAWDLVEYAESNWTWFSMANIVPDSGDAIVYEVKIGGSYACEDSAPMAICRAFLLWKAEQP